jgi:hypothetical protein
MAVDASVVDGKPELVPEALSRKWRGDSLVNQRRDEMQAVLTTNGGCGCVSMKYDEGRWAPASGSYKSRSPRQ